MPYSFTQEFTFETIYLVDLEKALSFICPIVFPKIENGMIVNTDVSSWKEDNYPSYAASYFLPAETPKTIPKLHQFICNIDRKNSYSENIFYSVEEIVKTVIDLAENADKEKFIEETGEGPFSGCEGTVMIGYRIHWRWQLIISLCHIYLSK